MDEDSIIYKILYKKDAFNDEPRISKTRAISLAVFVLMFLLVLVGNIEYGFEFTDIFAALISGVMFSLPFFIIGTIVAYITDNSARKSRMMEEYLKNSNNNAPPQQNAANINVQQSHTQINQPSAQNISQNVGNMDIARYVEKIGQSTNVSDVRREYDAVKNHGDEAVPVILSYLKRNSEQNSHFNGKKLLVQLLGDINTDKAYEASSEILFTSSRCTGWYNDVVAESARVLGDSGDKKWIPRLNDALDEFFAPVADISKAIEKLSGEKVEHPNVILDNVAKTMSGRDAIKYLYSLDISNWGNDQKAYYYYLMAFNSKRDMALSLTNLPKTFYAAQVYYNPAENVMGWQELGVEPSIENARRLHEEYPIPETFEEVENWGKLDDDAGDLIVSDSEESSEEPVDDIEEAPEDSVEEEIVEDNTSDESDSKDNGSAEYSSSFRKYV